MRDRLVADVALRVVMHELGQHAIDPSRGARFEPFREFAVQTAPASSRQRPVERFAERAARKRELIARGRAVFVEKTGVEEALDDGVEIGRPGGEQLEIAKHESATEHRRDCEHVARVGRQRLDAANDGLAHGRRQLAPEFARRSRGGPCAVGSDRNLAGVQKRLHQLLCKEWVAVRRIVQARGELGRYGRSAKQQLDVALLFCKRERLERDGQKPALVAERFDETRDRVAVVDVRGTVGSDDQQRHRQQSRQQVLQRPDRSGRGVEVLEEHDHRAVARDARERAREHFEHRRLIGGRFAQGVDCEACRVGPGEPDLRHLGEHREQPEQIREEFGERRDAGLVRTDEFLDRFAVRGVGNAEIRLGDATVQHAHPALGGDALEFVDDAALAGACRSRDEHQLTLAGHRKVEPPREARHLVLAADKLGHGSIGGLARARRARGDVTRFCRRMLLERGERAAEFARGLEPVGRRLCERAQNDAVDVDGQLGRARAWQRRSLCHVLRHEAHEFCGEKRRTSRQHFVEHAAERVHVAAAVHGEVLDLFGRHVPWRPDHRVRVRQRPVDGIEIGPQLGDAKVEDLDERTRGRRFEKDVLGFEVAVHDAGVVRGFERRGDLPGQPDGLLRAESFQLGELAAERPSRQVLHDDVHADVGRHPEVVDGDDVGVLEAGNGVGFALEPADGGLVAEVLGPDHLERDGSFQVELCRAVDGAHAALADARVDAVAVGDDPADERIGDGVSGWQVSFAFGDERVDFGAERVVAAGLAREERVPVVGIVLECPREELVDLVAPV